MAAAFIMDNERTSRFSRLMQLLATALLVTSLVALTTIGSMAEPSRAQLDSAREKLRTLEGQSSQLVEEYNAARVRLGEIQDRLIETQRELSASSQAEDEARGMLDERTSDAYSVGSGSRLEVLLGDGNFTDFSDRMLFLEQIAQDNRDLALQARNAGQRAAWARADLQEAKQQQQEEQAIIEERKRLIEELIAKQQDLVKKYELEYQAALEAEREAERAAAAAAGGTGDGGGGGGGVGNGYETPPASGGASTAVAVALDQVGDEYQWGAAGPDEFDCSGLTMYAWAKGGVSLPHSSGSQYASLPHISKSDLQPGDLLFYAASGNNISHVSMYIGGGRMVHAFSEGSPVSVDSVATWWVDHYVGAARPG